MSVAQVIRVFNEMRDAGVIERYAIGGAVGATFYIEPVATLGVDIFVALPPVPGHRIIGPQPVFRYLAARGYAMEGEYMMIGGWPVQVLTPGGSLGDEALEQAAELDVEGVAASVFTAEHLAAICLQPGRAKDWARLVELVDADVLDIGAFEAILARHDLAPGWEKFRSRFMEDTP